MITLSNTMAVLDSCPKHNMVAYLEKSEGNAEFHEIIDFLKRSSIHHALTVSPVVSTTFVEQFWTSAKSKIINNVRHITAKVAGKSVSISEASIRTNGGKHFSGKVTPLFATMLVQPTQDEGASSERPSEALPTPSPAQTSENLGGHSSSDKSLSGNEGDMTLQSVYDLYLSLCAQVSDQAKEIKHLKAQITKLKKQAKPVIKHHRSWLKSVSLKQRFPSKSFSKKHRVHKESVSKQGRKFAKGESSVQRDPLLMKFLKIQLIIWKQRMLRMKGGQHKWWMKTRRLMRKILSTEDVLSTDKEGVSTDMEKVSTDRPIVSTDGSKVSTDRKNEGTEEKNEGTEEHIEGTEEKVESIDGHKKGTEEEIATQTTQTSTQTPTSTIFGDDETIAKVLLNMIQAKASFREKWIKARIEADRLLAEKLEEQEREQFTIEERAKFLHVTMAAQRKFLA
ncbi:hypothetical protein Tco_0614502 [Tanacetum coccineum]